MQGKGRAPGSLLTIWRKRRMRWASCARNTCHTVLTWLPGDQSPSPSRPEKKSEGEDSSGEPGTGRHSTSHLQLVPSPASGRGLTFLCPVPGRQWGFSAYQDTDEVSHLHTEVLGPQVPTVWAYTCMGVEKGQLGTDPRTLAQMHTGPEVIEMGGSTEAEWVLTIGCPQLGLQWTQGRARGEVGSQVEFPMLGTVLWEGQAGGQVLHPVREGSCPVSSTQATRDAIKAPHYWGNFQRQAQTAKGDEKGEEEGRDGKRPGGGGKGGPARGPIHTCRCPRPPEVCAAGGPSPRLTLGELGGDK